MTEAALSYPDRWMRDLLAKVRTIAVVGASDKTIRPSTFVIKYLQTKGYKIAPINPRLAGKTVLGETVVADLADLAEPVDMVDIFRNADGAAETVDTILQLPWRPQIVWMQLGVRHDGAAAKAEAAGIDVVMDRCPKIEWARLNGEIGWSGISSRVITSKKRVLRK